MTKKKNTVLTDFTVSPKTVKGDVEKAGLFQESAGSGLTTSIQRPDKVSQVLVKGASETISHSESLKRPIQKKCFGTYEYPNVSNI